MQRRSVNEVTEQTNMSGDALHRIMRLHLNKFGSVSQVTCCEFFLQCPSHEIQLDAARFVEQIIGPDAAAHDPLIVRSLNRFCIAKQLAFVRARFVFRPPPQKNVRLRKSGSVEEAVPAKAC
jgi:hypothetical protein